ncbi:MAG: thioredoxin family protein [Chthoniobacterales bacterium]|nr:thioredoxin family protein [Chthoniobacterales bacterium]
MQIRLLTFVFILASLTSAMAAPNDSAQDQVLAAIKEPNVSIVHLWAPWCSNCQSELKSGGWAKIVKANPAVKFYFVSIWDNGDDGRAMLAKFELADQPNVTVLADSGPRGADKIKQFAGMPVGWIPTTWVCKGGNLRYAMNYGEIRFEVLQQFITDSTAKW